MQENNEQVVTEEVKPVEVVQTEVQTVPVDEIVGNTGESNNNNNNKGRSKREIVLIIVAALTMIASGVYFAFFNENDEEATGNNKAETVEKEDNKETTDDTTTKEDTNTDKKEETTENDELKESSIKIADMFVFATQFGFKTGKVADFDNKQLVNMTMLYLQESSEKCYDKQNIDSKAKELFGAELKSDDLPEGITLENNKYCKTDSWGAGSNTNPLSLSDSKVSKEDNKVVYQHIYSYDNNNTTIELEYKLENNNYVLVSVSKK